MEKRWSTRRGTARKLRKKSTWTNASWTRRRGVILVCPHLGHREQAHRLVSSRQKKSVRGAPCRSLHRQEQSSAFTDKHVWLSRRWSELGTRDLPGHDWNRVCAGQSIAVHLLPIRETTPCAGARRRLRTSRLHHQCQTFFFFLRSCRRSGLSRIEESLGFPCTTTACKAFECWAGSWNGPLMASLGKQIHDMQSLLGTRTE